MCIIIAHKVNVFLLLYNISRVWKEKLTIVTSGYIHAYVNILGAMKNTSFICESKNPQHVVFHIDGVTMRR